MRLYADTWAMGYEEALRDHGLDEERLRETHSDRVDRALRHLTEDRRRQQAEALIAMAAIAEAHPSWPWRVG